MRWVKNNERRREKEKEREKGEQKICEFPNLKRNNSCSYLLVVTLLKTLVEIPIY